MSLEDEIRDLKAVLCQLKDAIYATAGNPPAPLPGDSDGGEVQPPLGNFVVVSATHGLRYYKKENAKGYPIMDQKDAGFRAVEGEVYLVKPEKVKADGGSYWWQVIGRQSPSPTSFAIYDRAYHLDALKVQEL